MELLTLLRTIAPEFEELEDTVLQTWLDLTQPLVSKSAFGAAYEQAVAYLAAHRMKMAGLGESGAFGSAIDRAGVTSYTPLAPMLPRRWQRIHRLPKPRMDWSTCACGRQLSRSW